MRLFNFFSQHRFDDPIGGFIIVKVEIVQMFLECGRFAIWSAHAVTKVAVDAHNVLILLKPGKLIFRARFPSVERLPLFNVVCLIG